MPCRARIIARQGPDLQHRAMRTLPCSTPPYPAISAPSTLAPRFRLPYLVADAVVRQIELRERRVAAEHLRESDRADRADRRSAEIGLAAQQQAAFHCVCARVYGCVRVCESVSVYVGRAGGTA